jgi:hypothetical protein
MMLATGTIGKLIAQPKPPFPDEEAFMKRKR